MPGIGSTRKLVLDHFASERFNPQLLFGHESSDAWAIVYDIASSRPDLFIYGRDDGFDSFAFGEFISELETALASEGVFPDGKLWVPPSPGVLVSPPSDWGGVSPVNPAQLSEAATKYLKQPAWQNNRADWIFMSAFLFDSLARVYDATMSNAGGSKGLAYVFSGGDVTKMLFWRLGLGVSGFVLRWLLVPLIVALIWYRNDGADVGQTWLWLLGTWAAYAVIRLATLPVRVLHKRKRGKLVQSMLEKLGRLERAYVSVNTGVFSPTVMKTELQAINAEGVPVPGAVFAIMDRAIQRDSAVFAR